MVMGFKWVLNDKMAGSGKPGLYDEPMKDIEFLKENGIKWIYNLTETGLDEEFDDKGFNIVHFSIPDMGIPMPKNAFEICKEIKSNIESGEKVLVHCKGGLGRTGTIIACVLVEMGYSPEDAIIEVRKNIRLAIQNSLQENFISNYQKYSLAQAAL